MLDQQSLPLLQREEAIPMVKETGQNESKLQRLELTFDVLDQTPTFAPEIVAGGTTSCTSTCTTSCCSCTGSLL